jgi:hypothetical protein
MRSSSAIFVLLLMPAACGGAKTQPAAPDEVASEAGASEDSVDEAASDEEAPAESAGLPRECKKKGSTCVPPKRFVQELCSGSFPGVTLYLFGDGSPWTRGYLRGKTKAWNASGGASDNESWLEFDEEVLVLAERKADLGGMQVSGAGASYDALRWDGSCVTLSAEEMTLDRPPSPKNSKVDWRYLDDNVQEALREDSSVNDAYLARRKECKGATSGEVTMKCVKADEKLSAAVVKAVRGGAKLPEPTKVP